MIHSLSNKLIAGIAVLVAMLWTLALGLIYGVVSATDNVWRWLNAVVSIPAELSQWLSAVGSWVANSGIWLLLFIWAMGLIVLMLLALLARRIARLIPRYSRAGGFS